MIFKKSMITVDCSDVMPIQHDLLIYVSDDIGAIPAVKRHEFVLSPIESDDFIEISNVTESIKKYLNSIGESQNFGIISKSDNVFIQSIKGKKMDRLIKPVHSIRSCCGL